jgi:superfamily II RNA helicase
MDILKWQKTDKNDFAKFIRDISINKNNIKHMLEDYENEKKIETVEKKKNKKKHNKKKKDLIIEENMKKKYKESISNDFKKIDYFIDNLVDDNIYKNISNLKTEEGIIEYKFRLLKYFWSDKKKYMQHIMNLYFSLHKIDTEDEDYKKIIKKFENKLEDYDYKLYMMKELSHMLPPLNLWDQRKKTLDEWQLETIDLMKKNKSVIVKAPTSSGKSFVGYCAGVLFSRVLYVCPAKPIAYQVGASFMNMGYKVCFLLNPGEILSYDDKTNIFIGTPEIIEDHYNNINIKYDFAVFDEIHNLNKEDDGHIYENLLKYYDCNFLGLSATMNNIDEFRDKLLKIHPDKNIEIVKYDKRFINLQKWLYSNNKLELLHPLCSTELNDLNDDFLKKNHQFTPKDSALLWEKLEDVFEKEDKEEIIEHLSPDNIFEEDSILSLDDTREYEDIIKRNLVSLKDKEPELIQNVLTSFKGSENVSENNNILGFLKVCKEKELLPMIIFNMSTTICMDIFYDIFDLIEKDEKENYPYYNKILEKKNDLFKKYIEQRNIFSEKMKISKTNDPVNEKREKMENYDKKEKTKYISEVLSIYDNIIIHLEKDKYYKQRKYNLQKEKNQFLKRPDFCYIDIFQKHPEYCFSPKESMSGDKIRSIRKEILRTMGIKISYEHPLFQLLKRGIGIYTEDMPEEYKWILQKLMTNRDIGIVISDRTLCLGIDLPILTTCIMGYKDSNIFTNDDFLQMSGRAGRRGLDVKGNTIFYDVDYKSILNSENPFIRGNIKCVKNRYKCCTKDITKLFDNYINNDKIIDDAKYTITEYPQIQWLCRKNNKIDVFLEKLENMNRKIFLKELDEPHIHILKLFTEEKEFITSYKNNKVYNIKLLKELNVIMVKIYNYLKDKRYNYIKIFIRDIFEKTKKLILNHYKLN